MSDKRYGAKWTDDWSRFFVGLTVEELAVHGDEWTKPLAQDLIAAHKKIATLTKALATRDTKGET